MLSRNLLGLILVSLILWCEGCHSDKPTHQGRVPQGALGASDSGAVIVASPIDAVSTATSTATSMEPRWYVADAEADRILAVAADGRLQYTIGRRGAGPGELKTPTAVGAAGDSVFVADLGNRRITTYSHHGRYLASRSAPTDCVAGSAAKIRATSRAVYVLYKCHLTKNEVQLRVVEFSGNSAFRTIIADTVRARNRDITPIAFPLFDMSGDRIVLGHGDDPCFKMLDPSAPSTIERRCLANVSRTKVAPDVVARLRRRAEEKLEVPDLLPHAISVVLRGDTIYLLHPISDTQAEWVAVPLAAPAAPLVQISKPFIGSSFFDGISFLSFSGSDGGYVPKVERFISPR